MLENYLCSNYVSYLYTCVACNVINAFGVFVLFIFQKYCIVITVYSIILFDFLLRRSFCRTIFSYELFFPSVYVGHAMFPPIDSPSVLGLCVTLSSQPIARVWNFFPFIINQWSYFSLGPDFVSPSAGFVLPSIQVMPASSPFPYHYSSENVSICSSFLVVALSFSTMSSSVLESTYASMSILFPTICDTM